MRSSKFPVVYAIVLVFLILALLARATRATAQQETVLHNFNVTNGYQPVAGLIFDAGGNLYGTTSYGGPHGPLGYGTVFELLPTTSGKGQTVWKEKVLHTFNVKNGYYPLAGLVFDASGNLYGTTYWGGKGADPPCNDGCGTVFELSHNVKGGWSEKVLHSFGNGTDGAYPRASLIFDTAGNLYGTTNFGGANGVGTVFELMPQKGGRWTETVLHSFINDNKDGTSPAANLIFDAAGNLYGTTFGGGAYNYGTVFELTPQHGGTWTETVLHNFDYNGSDGANPSASLIFDAAGSLYGATSQGGSYNYGTVFKATPAKGGTWTVTVLYSFNDSGAGGYSPLASLIFDASGNLYGTTSGGAYGGGAVFELTPKEGNWTETVLYDFNSGNGGGWSPSANLIFDAAGNLFGTTVEGGADNAGVVFEITP